MGCGVGLKVMGWWKGEWCVHLVGGILGWWGGVGGRGSNGYTEQDGGNTQHIHTYKYALCANYVVITLLFVRHMYVP